jgi:hypothetical protein
MAAQGFTAKNSVERSPSQLSMANKLSIQTNIDEMIA